LVGISEGDSISLFPAVFLEKVDYFFIGLFAFVITHLEIDRE